jgi:hypothetical protein
MAQNLKLLMDLVLEVKSSQDVMQSRMDRHSTANETRLGKIESKIDLLFDRQNKDKMELLEKISENQIDSVKDLGMTKEKVAGLSGFISLIVTALTMTLKEFFHK